MLPSTVTFLVSLPACQFIFLSVADEIVQTHKVKTFTSHTFDAIRFCSFMEDGIRTEIGWLDLYLRARSIDIDATEVVFA